jgi:hypothetical protein
MEKPKMPRETTLAAIQFAIADDSLKTLVLPLHFLRD